MHVKWSLSLGRVMYFFCFMMLVVLGLSILWLDWLSICPGGICPPRLRSQFLCIQGLICRGGSYVSRREFDEVSEPSINVFISIRAHAFECPGGIFPPGAFNSLVVAGISILFECTFWSDSVVGGQKRTWLVSISCS